MTAAERPLESYNPFDPAVQEDPWDYYALLQREACHSRPASCMHRVYTVFIHRISLSA